MQFKHFKKQFYILDNAHVVYLGPHGDYISVKKTFLQMTTGC